MKRRHLLAAAGVAAGSSVVSGCLTGPSGSEDPEGTGTPSDPPGGELPTQCPEYDRVDRVVCYDGIDPGAVDGYLEPSSRSIGTDEPIEFTLHNRSEQTLQTNFYNWMVHKFVDDEWFHVAPRGWNDPMMFVESGETHTWTLTVDNEGIEAGESVPRSGGTEAITVGGFGGGDYAFRGRGWFEGESHESATAFAATFAFDGEPLELTTTDAVEETEWDDDSLVARSSRGDPDGDSSRLGAYELRPVEDPDEEPTRMIPEQVVRNERLRDVVALAIEHDAEEVRLEEYDSTVPIFGSNSPSVFEYEDTYYEVTARELDGGDE